MLVFKIRIMKSNLKYYLALFVMVLLFLECVNSTFPEPVYTCIDPQLTKTKELSDIYLVATNTTKIYNANDILEGYVISSEEGGNFYKSMYFQVNLAFAQSIIPFSRFRYFPLKYNKGC